jgi:Ion channel
MLFMQIELFRPGSFTGLGSENLASGFLCFSLITIASLGYGDILPAIAFARVLSGFEFIGGTLYIAIIIGRVVGKFL